MDLLVLLKLFLILGIINYSMPIISGLRNVFKREGKKEKKEEKEGTDNE